MAISVDVQLKGDAGLDIILLLDPLQERKQLIALSKVALQRFGSQFLLALAENFLERRFGLRILENGITLAQIGQVCSNAYGLIHATQLIYQPDLLRLIPGPYTTFANLLGYLGYSTTRTAGQNVVVVHISLHHGASRSLNARMGCQNRKNRWSDYSEDSQFIEVR